MKLQIATQFADGGQVNSETLVNMFAEAASGKSEVELRSVAGLTLFSTIGTSPIRGQLVHADVLYVVAGTTLYSVGSGGTATSIGTIAGTELVQMASNGTELAIVANGSIYIYESNALTLVTDPDAPSPTSIAYLDGYFIFGDGTNSFYLSPLYDGSGDYDALDFASAESNPDVITRVFVDHRELLLFGTETVETWFNSGDADFPFQRVSGGITEKGIAGINAVAKIDNTVFWLDKGGVVRRLTAGYSPQRISTHEIERELVRGTLADAECFAYSTEGHEFFVLTVPEVGTWIYDAATNLWHQRKSQNDTRWRARCYSYAYGKHLVGDYSTGKLWELDADSFVEGTDDLIAEVVFPPIYNDGDRFRMHRLLLDVEAGEADPYSEPQIRLDLSNDGSDWFTVGYGSLGRSGNRSTRTRWARLGQHRTLHLRFLISDPANRAIYSAYAEVAGDK
jgi:hypothetical protein